MEYRPLDSYSSYTSGFNQYESPEEVQAADIQAVQSFFDFNGDKFSGGFGATHISNINYVELRARSAQLFREVPYAKGIINRLVTGEVGTGLHPELTPEGDFIGLDEEQATDWGEATAKRFEMWGSTSRICDWEQDKTFWAIERHVRRESLIDGDILVILEHSRTTRLPSIRTVSAVKVESPWNEAITDNHTVSHGVEKDGKGRVVAYWVSQDNGTSKRVPAFGARTGRRLAWLVFGSEKRIDETRGIPLLACVLQSLRDIDRYKDSTQRKALVNSFWAASVTKEHPVLGSKPFANGVRNTTTIDDNEGHERKIVTAETLPGLQATELQHGEKLNFHGGQGTDLSFADFEMAIIQGIAWSLEIPPEILTLSFNSNYSASQAAINMSKEYESKIWAILGETFCQRVYVEWLVSEVLVGNIVADGFLEAWRDKTAYAEYAAWVSSEWYGAVKPSTDMFKAAKGSRELIDQGLSTHAREARNLSGTSYAKNVRILKKENELLADARRPLLELEQEFSVGEDTNVTSAVNSLEDVQLELLERVEELGA